MENQKQQKIKKRSLFYILHPVSKKIKQVDAMEWAKWFETNRKYTLVKKSKIKGVVLETVFTGINRNPFDTPPHVYESTVFGGINDLYQEHFESWEKAEEGHAFIREALINGVDLLAEEADDREESQSPTH